MKIKYVGHCQNLAVEIPIGSGKSKQSLVHFSPNAVKEVSEEDGARLLELDPKGRCFQLYGDENLSPVKPVIPQEVSEVPTEEPVKEEAKPKVGRKPRGKAKPKVGRKPRGKAKPKVG